MCLFSPDNAEVNRVRFKVTGIVTCMMGYLKKKNFGWKNVSKSAVFGNAEFKLCIF